MLLISFFEQIVPLALVIVLVLNLFSVSIADRWFYLQKRYKVILAFVALYMVTVIGVFYSADKPSAWFDLEVKLSFVLAPLFLLTSNFINRYTIVPLLKTFVFGVSSAMVIQLIISSINYSDTGNLGVFYYTLFSFFHHPSYFSMYTNFAIGTLIVLIFHSRNRPKPIMFVLLGFLAVGVYLLSSRAGLLTFIVLMGLSFIRILFPVLKWKKMLLAMVITCTAIVAVVIGINQFSGFSRKVDAGNSGSSAGIRLEMWKASVPLIKENFFFGVGTGDVNRELQTIFAQKRLKRAVRDNLNAHNQIIQTQVALGIVGTIALLMSFLYPFILAIKRGNLFFPMFAVIMGINFLTESMFNAQAGVLFYSLINASLYFTYGD
jgi:O-antigen ligase